MSRADVNPLAPKKPGVIEAARRVKSWARALLELEETTVISANELACHLPGCLPRETVVLTKEGKENPFQFSVHKAVINLTRDDIRSAAMKEGR